jgi:hypothetical protein
MDYKYIEQLLERYWQGETTLQEEAILRNFFSQPEAQDIPESLRKFQALFTVEQEEPLGDDFDARILEMIGEEEPKAKIVTLTSRLMPLFKAAAIVAIILTLGNAAQAPWNYGWDNPQDEYAKFHQQQNADSVNMLSPVQAENITDSTMAPKPESPQFIE